MARATESFEFQAETKQLLEIVIHSLYTDKAIFIRELISNASDALDRLRLEALTKPELIGDESLEIRLEADPEARTLKVIDNGIGMSRTELVRNLGTIAKSGTRELVRKMKNRKPAEWSADLIGQFGVGFYSAFMAADEVEVETRRAGQKSSTKWRSKGDGEFTVESGERQERGTSITLHLKPADPEGGLEDFTDSFVLSRMVKRFSDFVAYPIVSKERKEVSQEGSEKGGESEKTVVFEDKTLNSMRPLWTRAGDEVEEEEFNEFYKHISHDWEPPLKRLSFRAEGRLEYQTLLFIPSRAPFDLFYPKTDFGLQLYARRVLIMESCADLIPQYLRFVKGVVDSSDLPLNISRQRLQDDRHITQMRKWIARKIIEALAKMQKDESEKYEKFWEQFGATLKEGVASDWENRDKLIPLLRFQSSKDAEKLTTLKDYLGRMQEGQKGIYYLTGESRIFVENSPHLEAFKEKGLEVLYLVEPIDEFMVQSLQEFEGHPLKSVGKGQIDLSEEGGGEKEIEDQNKDFSELLGFLQKKLDESIKEVRLSKRLTKSPVCLVGADTDVSPQLEKMLERAQQGRGKQKRILELNSGHPVIIGIKARFDENRDDSSLSDYAELLLGYGLLAEGSELPDPNRFGNLVAQLMAGSLGVAQDAEKT